MGLLSVAFLAAPGLAHAQPVDLFYERTVMKAADARCGLFAPEIGTALATSAAQARGAALRAGVSPAVLDATERTAEARASGVPCRSKDLDIAAQRVRTAFGGYARIPRLTFPGDLAAWRADRAAEWRLAQDVRFGGDQLTFGIVGHDETTALVAVGRFADGAQPYAARVLMRDVERTPGPYLDRWGGGATARLPLDRRLPPRMALTGFMAEARSPAGDLVAKGGGPGWAFRMPAEAARALGKLDPREAVAVEFLFPGDVVRRAYVEVGDFAAGEAFLKVAAR
jgi:hypothetical protein